MVDVVGVLVTAGISATMSAVTGVAVKLAIERKYTQAAAAAEAAKKRRVEFTDQRCAWMWAAGRVLYHLVRWAQGRKEPNGDLDKAFNDLELIERAIKGMERLYAAEAQEE